MRTTIKEDHSLNGILEIIGSKLLELRIKKGYSSHVDFAAEHNLPRIQYWRMEKGKTNVTLKSLNKVLAIHDLTIQELFMQIEAEARKKK
jgi:transcriptional regulator with XRE-family HTH domain